MRGPKQGRDGVAAGSPPGIIIREQTSPPPRPRIAAFIWGGKTRPVPTLPYGRWKRTDG